MVMVEQSQIIGDAICLACGVLGGGVVAGFLSLLQYRAHRRAKPLAAPELRVDPIIEQQLDEAATKWAEANGHPAARALVARKLQLGYRLALRRQASRWPR
jgi:hypothetical protein